MSKIKNELTTILEKKRVDALNLKLSATQQVDAANAELTEIEQLLSAIGSPPPAKPIMSAYFRTQAGGEVHPKGILMKGYYALLRNGEIHGPLKYDDSRIQRYYYEYKAGLVRRYHRTGSYLHDRSTNEYDIICVAHKKETLEWINDHPTEFHLPRRTTNREFKTILNGGTQELTVGDYALLRDKRIVGPLYENQVSTTHGFGLRWSDDEQNDTFTCKGNWHPNGLKNTQDVMYGSRDKADLERILTDPQRYGL